MQNETLEKMLEHQQTEISEIKDTQNGIAETLHTLVSMESGVKANEQNIKDHETRIRALESYKWVTVLMALVITSGVAFMGNKALELATHAEENPPITKADIIDAIKQGNKKDVSDNN